MMLTQPSIVNFFIPNVRQRLIHQPRRVRGILEYHVRVMLTPSFEREDRVRGANILKESARTFRSVLKLFMSRAPDLEEHVNQDQRHAAPNR